MALLLLGLLVGSVAGYVTRPGAAPIERVQIGAAPSDVGADPAPSPGSPSGALPDEPLQGPPPAGRSPLDLGSAALADDRGARQFRHIGLFVLGGGAAGLLLGFAVRS